MKGFLLEILSRQSISLIFCLKVRLLRLKQQEEDSQRHSLINAPIITPIFRTP
jgi:hypothetical protein